MAAFSGSMVYRLLLRSPFGSCCLVEGACCVIDMCRVLNPFDLFTRGEAGTLAGVVMVSFSNHFQVHCAGLPSKDRRELDNKVITMLQHTNVL